MPLEACLEAFISLVQQNYIVLGIALVATTVLMIGLIGAHFTNMRRLKKSMRMSYEPTWLLLDEAKISDGFKRYIAKQSQPLSALGYVSAGVYLTSENPVTRTEAACYLHPGGHDVIEILHIDGTLEFEIISYLDDGSVISSNVIEDALARIERLRRVSRPEAEKFLANHPELDADKHFAEMAPHGFLVRRYPGSTIEELVEKHQHAVQAVLADPKIGLRKLTPENLREYALYQTRHFNQIMFELGRKDNAPQPFVFPEGEQVGDQFGQSAQSLAAIS